MTIARDVLDKTMLMRQSVVLFQNSFYILFQLNDSRDEKHGQAPKYSKNQRMSKLRKMKTSAGRKGQPKRTLMEDINNVNYSDIIYISKSCVSTKLTVILSCIVLDNDEEDAADDSVVRDQLYSPGFQFSCHLDFFFANHK